MQHKIDVEEEQKRAIVNSTVPDRIAVAIDFQEIKVD
jgi:hypothetical protein